MRYAIILIIFCMLPVAFADTIHVPGDYPTIQKAIDAAVTGDTVLVAPNTYYEKIDFLGKDITVTSESGSGVTILDAIGVGSVVTLTNEESSNAVLEGFTLRNGGGTPYKSNKFGGGIYIKGSSPLIDNCIIEDNSFTGSGGGVAILDGDSSGVVTSPIIKNCVIRNNNALRSNVGGAGGGILIRTYDYMISSIIQNCRIEYNYSGLNGAGISIDKNVNCEIFNCQIRHNETETQGGGVHLNSFKLTHIYSCIINNNCILSGGFGAGICIKGHEVNIHDNLIHDNNILINGHGTGIAIFTQYFIIKDNLIYNNHSINNGGGISFFGTIKKYMPQQFINNIIFNNSADNIGGGIYFFDVDMDFINYTISGNTADIGGGIGVCGNSTLFMANCILWDNEATTSDNEVYLESGATATIIYSDIEGGYTGTSNIDADPLFVDPTNNDFHLTYNSPCMNTGVNSAVVDIVDIDGNPRICDGNVDMGFDEFFAHLYVTGDKTPSGSIEGKLVGVPGTTPVGLFVGSGVLPSYFKTIWGEFWLDAPWFLFGPLGNIPSNGVMVLSTTLPGSIPAPYDILMQALIGLNADSLTNLCVLEVR